MFPARGDADLAATRSLPGPPAAGARVLRSERAHTAILENGLRPRAEAAQLTVDLANERDAGAEEGQARISVIGCVCRRRGRQHLARWPDEFDLVARLGRAGR